MAISVTQFNLVDAEHVKFDILKNHEIKSTVLDGASNSAVNKSVDLNFKL